MSDQDIKQLFDRLKTENQAGMPDFDELLARQQEAVIATKGRSFQFTRWWMAAAAAVLITISAAWWIWGQGPQPSKNQLIAGQEEVDDFETTTNLNDIDQWEWTESANIHNPDEKTPNGIKVELPQEVKEVINASPDLSEELYVHGAIADWQSPTQGLMPF